MDLREEIMNTLCNAGLDGSLLGAEDPIVLTELYFRFRDSQSSGNICVKDYGESPLISRYSWNKEVSELIGNFGEKRFNVISTQMTVPYQGIIHHNSTAVVTLNGLESCLGEVSALFESYPEAKVTYVAQLNAEVQNRDGKRYLQTDASKWQRTRVE